MPPFRFVHAADLHLDSPFKGLEQLGSGSEEQPGSGSEHIATALREATFKAFDSVIDLCIKQKADFLLVAGDVYDGTDRSLKAQIYFRDGLEQLSNAGVRSYVIHGNHDPLDGRIAKLKMPSEVSVFESKLTSETFEKEGKPVARIHGISYPKKEIGTTFGKGFKREGDEPFQIGLFHCNTGGQVGHGPYAPRTVEELAESGLDYWALGHIHEKKILSEKEPFIGYPGNTQGRHINEAGERGCFMVKVSGAGEISSQEFVSTDAVRWLRIEVDISSLESIDDLKAALENRISEIPKSADGRDSIARVTLTGRGPVHSTLIQDPDAEDILIQLRDSGMADSPFVWIEKLEIQTQPAVDIEKRRETPDFLGDLLNLIQEYRASPDRLAELQASLNELYTHKRAKKLLDSRPDGSVLLRLLEEAESRCVDFLAEVGE